MSSSFEESSTENRNSLEFVIIASSEGLIIDQTVIVVDIEKTKCDVPVIIFSEEIYTGVITEDLTLDESLITIPDSIDDNVDFTVENCK